MKQIFKEIVKADSDKERLKIIKESSKNINDIFGYMVKIFMHNIEAEKQVIALSRNTPMGKYNYTESITEICEERCKGFLKSMIELCNFFLSNYKLDFDYISNNYPDINKIILDQV